MDCGGLTTPGSVQRLLVKDINALQLSDDLQPLQTSSLLEISGDGASLGSDGDEVGFGLDLCGES